MYNKVFVLCLLVAAICLILAVILSFLWRVLDVYDEITGRKAKRQVKKLKDKSLNITTDLSAVTMSSDLVGDNVNLGYSMSILEGTAGDINSDEVVSDVKDLEDYVTGMLVDDNIEGISEPVSKSSTVIGDNSKDGLAVIDTSVEDGCPTSEVADVEVDDVKVDDVEVDDVLSTSEVDDDTLAVASGVASNDIDEGISTEALGNEEVSTSFLDDGETELLDSQGNLISKRFKFNLFSWFKGKPKKNINGVVIKDVEEDSNISEKDTIEDDYSTDFLVVEDTVSKVKIIQELTSLK